MSDTNRLNRREFLGAGQAAAAGVMATKWSSPALGDDSAPATQPAKRPNILLIITDEHNARVMGAAGNPIINTQHMDSLARNGIVFDNCYCNSPLCGPSRHALTSGKYVSRIKVWSNNCWLPSADYPSIARVMTAAGYDSYLSGKMHYDYSRRYGFDEIWPSPLNTYYQSGTGGRRSPDKIHEGPGYSSRCKSFRTGNESGVLNHDRQVVTHTVDFLKNRKADEKPFFMIAGFIAPHFPLIVPDEYYHRYKGRVPMPVIPPGSVEAQPLNYKLLRAGFHVGHIPPEITRRGRELYYGLTNWVDDQIGKVLTALETSAVGQDTIVIYTADHGENMGEHVMWWKSCMYEHAAHVPLIVSYPQRWQGGQRRSEVCSLVDVVQTVADLGGTKTPSDWNGRSLTSVLDDPKAKGRDMAVSEYYADNIASGYTMIRRGQFKYTYHTSPGEHYPVQRQLFDLSTDLPELHNLADDPKFKDLVNDLHLAMVTEVGESPEDTERSCRAGFEGYGRRDAKPEKHRGKDKNGSGEEGE